MRNILAATLFCMTMVPTALADIIVLKSGKHFQIEGSYEVKGKNALFRDSNGELIQIPLSIIDIEKSRQANEAAEAARQAKADELVVQPPKPPSSIQAVAESVDSTNKDGSARSVSISNKRLKEYTETNDRAKDSRITTGVATPGSSSDTPSGGETGPSVDQLSDPAYMAEARQRAGQEIGKLEKEIADLDANIKEAEEVQEANEASLAYQDNYTGDGEVTKGDPDEDPGPSPYDTQLEKTKKTLKTLKEKKAEKEAELTKAKASARVYGVKKGVAPKEPKAEENQESPTKEAPQEAAKESPKAKSYR